MKGKEQVVIVREKHQSVFFALEFVYVYDFLDEANVLYAFPFYSKQGRINQLAQIKAFQGKKNKKKVLHCFIVWSSLTIQLGF